MSEETKPSGEEPSPEASETPENGESVPVQDTPPVDTSEPATAEPLTEAPKKSGLSRLMPFALFAVVPALVVGVLVFALYGGSDEDASIAGLDSLILRYAPGGDIATPFLGEAPPGFPEDFPSYSGVREVVSYAIRSPQGTTFIVVYDTSDSEEEVYAFFLEELDKGSWQVQAAVSGIDFTGMQFTRSDSADVQGDLAIRHTELDGRTGITVVFTDISQSDRPVEDFVLPPTRDLPPGFPNDIPIFAGNSSESVVIEAFFRRDAGSVTYFIVFLTKDADIDVINFYTLEFQNRGWDVVTARAQPGDFSLAIDFQDGQTQDVSGSVSADFFADDPAYTVVELVVQVSPARGRGN